MRRADDERVKALVYVAALAPDEGETVAEIFYKDIETPSFRDASDLKPCGDKRTKLPACSPQTRHHGSDWAVQDAGNILIGKLFTFSQQDNLTKLSG
jgi:hypothetical protein